MRIYDKKFPDNKEFTQGINRVANAEVSKRSATAKEVTSGDRVDISDRAKEIARLMAEVKALPEIRQQKVEELQKAIQSGDYKIDPAKIAARIIEEL